MPLIERDDEAVKIIISWSICRPSPCNRLTARGMSHTLKAAHYSLLAESRQPELFIGDTANMKSDAQTIRIEVAAGGDYR